MKRAGEVSNVHGEVHFKQKQRLNTLPHRKQSCKGVEYFIVDKIACHQHATVPKMNSPTAPPRNHNTLIKLIFTRTKTCMETPLNRNPLRIEAKKKQQQQQQKEKKTIQINK